MILLGFGAFGPKITIDVSRIYASGGGGSD